MKKHTLSAAIALAAVSATGAFASEGSDLAPIYLDRTAISVDAGYMMDIDNLSVDSLWGGTIGMSYIFNRSENSAHSIGLTFGYFSGSESTNYPAFSETISDAGVTLTDFFYPRQKISQEIIPVTLSYHYYHNVTNNITAYFGARAGLYISKSTAKSRIDTSSKITVGSYELPGNTGFDAGESANTSVSPVVGMEVGIEYKLSKKWAWHVCASLDAAFNMNRVVPCDEHSKGAEWAAYEPEVNKETVISTTLRTGFSYQF